MRSTSTRGPVASPSGAERGFTLIEALVALALFGLTALAALEAASASLRAQADHERRREQASLAEAKLSEILLWPVDSLTAWTGERAGVLVLDGRRYVWRARARPEAADLWHVSVEVRGAGGTFTLETRAYRRPPAGSRPRGDGS